MNPSEERETERERAADGSESGGVITTEAKCETKCVCSAKATNRMGGLG